MPYNAYTVLKLKKDFTIDELKKNYKHLAFKCHPDKNLMNVAEANKQIKILTECYKELVGVYKAREADKTYIELKSESTRESKKELPKNPIRDMDNDKFNEFFQKNKFKTEKDDGYSSWMKNSKEDTAAQTSLKIYEEPTPFGINTKLGYHELDDNIPNDFSGDNINNRLKFMDYKVAHTTSKLVDSGFEKNRATFQTLDSYKNARDSQKLEMTEDDIRMFTLKKEKEKEAENKRLQRIRDLDDRIFNHSQKVQATLSFS